MGWKNVKEAYRIGHIVAVYKGEGLCIGSPYVHDLIRITPEGVVTWGAMGGCKGGELARYYDEMTTDRESLVSLMQSPDTFSKSVTVFTYNGAQIIEKQCEEPGWPNVTHDGELMYENTFSTDKATVVAWAKRSESYEVDAVERRIKELREDLTKRESDLEEAKDRLDMLNADYPE